MKSMAVLLGASVLLNLVLIVRRPASPEPVVVRAVPPPRPSAAEVPSPGRLDAAVELDSLRARVLELEAERSARTEDVAFPERAGLFREKLARALRLMKDPRWAVDGATEARLDLAEATTEFERARLERWKNPRAYTDRLAAVLEQVAAESKAPLDEGQRAGLRRVLDEYAGVLDGMAGKDALDRYVQELGPEADVLQRLRALVAPEHHNRLAGLGALNPWPPSVAAWVDRRQAESHLVQTWIHAYGLEEAQRSQATAAARLYLSGADALNAQMGLDAVPGRETPQWRRRSAEILVDALGALESALTPEQRERLRRVRPADVRVYDPATFQRFAR